MYDDIPDEKLVTSLHKKFYSDIPLEDFSKQVEGPDFVMPGSDTGELSGVTAEYERPVPELPTTPRAQRPPPEEYLNQPQAPQ